VHKQGDLVAPVSTFHDVAELLIAIPHTSFRGVALGEVTVAHIARPIQFVFWSVISDNYYSLSTTIISPVSR